LSQGFFSIGVYHPKTEHNIGTLWRSAWQLGAHEIFVIAPRFPEKQSSDTVSAWRNIPLRVYDSVESLRQNLPYSTQLIAVEQGGMDVGEFQHPARACYLLGAEDHGLPAKEIGLCHGVVTLPAVRAGSLNVAVAGALVMYDRLRAG
jgi:tRNA G18 (ribose-2'-O)-methylase SpoU